MLTLYGSGGLLAAGVYSVAEVSDVVKRYATLVRGSLTAGVYFPSDGAALKMTTVHHRFIALYATTKCGNFNYRCYTG